MANILIVEDHPVVVEGLQKLLSGRGIASTCMVAYSVKECHHILKACTPDLILLDYNLPDGNGIDLCRDILKKYADLKILAISSYKEQGLVRRMIDNGAKGYVLKNASEDEIIEAITTVLSGKNYICEETQNILEGKQGTSIIITRREIEVLKYISEGMTNVEIAEKLFISPLTVDSHRKNLIIKLNAKNTASLIKTAFQKGYLD
jgi:DNA-binding NarL/FixJ family response regulator